MQIEPSARKPGVPDEDMLFALAHLVRYREQEYEEEERIFVIGPDRGGRFLELVLVPAGEPARIIHADVLQPNHDDYL